MFLKQRTSNESMNNLSLFSKRIWAIMKNWEGEVKINFTQIGCWVRWLLPVCFCDCIVSGSFQKSAKNAMYPNLPQSPSSERIVQNFYFFLKQQILSSRLPYELEKIKTWSLKKQNILMFSVFWAEGFHKKKISKYYQCSSGERKFSVLFNTNTNVHRALENTNSFYVGHQKAFIYHDCHCWLDIYMSSIGEISILLPSS